MFPKIQENLTHSASSYCYTILFFFYQIFYFFSFSPSFFHRHLSSKKNLGHLGKTVQALLNQVQKYVYDYNMGRMGQGNSNSSQTGA